MKILVTEPAGNIGRLIVSELLSPEFSVRVLTREPRRLPEEVREQTEVVYGAGDDLRTLISALEGVESVFWCVPPAPEAEVEVRGHHERFAHALAGAVREAETPRVVAISTPSGGRTGNTGLVSGWQDTENILNESGAAIRHLRCGVLMENLLREAKSIGERGMFSFRVPGQLPMPLVAAHDIADVALQWLARGNWAGIECQAVLGPQRLCFDQVAVVLERILERPVRYVATSANLEGESLVEIGGRAEYSQGLIRFFAELAGGREREAGKMAVPGTSTLLGDWARAELLPLAMPAISPAGRNGVMHGISAGDQ